MRERKAGVSGNIQTPSPLKNRLQCSCDSSRMLLRIMRNIVVVARAGRRRVGITLNGQVKRASTDVTGLASPTAAGRAGPLRERVLAELGVGRDLGRSTSSVNQRSTLNCSLPGAQLRHPHIVPAGPLLRGAQSRGQASREGLLSLFGQLACLERGFQSKVATDWPIATLSRESWPPLSDTSFTTTPSPARHHIHNLRLRLRLRLRIHLRRPPRPHPVCCSLRSSPHPRLRPMNPTATTRRCLQPRDPLNNRRGGMPTHSPCINAPTVCVRSPLVS